MWLSSMLLLFASMMVTPHHAAATTLMVTGMALLMLCAYWEYQLRHWERWGVCALVGFIMTLVAPQQSPVLASIMVAALFALIVLMPLTLLIHRANYLKNIK